jgi:biotin transport system substrate-specific component
MNVTISRQGFLDARHRFFEWRNELDYARKTLLALAFACLTGLGAFIRIYTPFTPVPFTAQVFFVLLSGSVLGHVWGGVSQSLYLGIGLLGVPWFSGGIGGTSVLLGPTAGYLFGFIAAAFLIGWFTDKYPASRRFRYHLPVMILAVLVLYAFGVLVLAINASVSIWEALLLGAVPFIALDIVKAILAASAGKIILTKEPFTR